MSGKTPEQVVREAQALVQQVKTRLAASAPALKPSGPPLSQEQRAKAEAEARAMFEQDMQNVEREVAEEAARLRFAAPPDHKPGGPRKPRNMI